MMVDRLVSFVEKVLRKIIVGTSNSLGTIKRGVTQPFLVVKGKMYTTSEELKSFE